MGIYRSRKCPICGQNMTTQLTKTEEIGLVCLHPHTAAMIEEFTVRTKPHADGEDPNNEGAKGSNCHG